MASELESNTAAARGYGEALYELAAEQGRVELIESQLAELAALWKREPAFAGLMSPAIDEDPRRQSLRRVFAGKVDPLVLNLLLVLNDRRRGHALPQVAAAFREVSDLRRGRLQVWVTSAVALSDSERVRLVDDLKLRTSMQPVLNEKVDPSILGGLVVQVGDKVMDTSVQVRLRRLRSELSRRMERHLYEMGERFMQVG